MDVRLNADACKKIARIAAKRYGVTMTKPHSIVAAGAVSFSNTAPVVLIAGPCQMESRQHAFDMAGALKEMCKELGIGFVYKTSFDKANRSSLASARGIGFGPASEQGRG